ncbi:hypothetical protein CLV37_102482 [Kineococcus rhizosphaerae]|uniref:Uncharacterized protein n=2 Tax=Kineococcus rhizosphaerae TaxID=559628 RepID=A0A2T0R8P0_9ACTN|nr:hypothetical protein CLV37_102482 [Kineococcus rhizosphaerae]
MDVLVSRTPHNVVDQDDRVLEEVPGLDEAEFFLWLKWIDNHWVIWEAN